MRPLEMLYGLDVAQLWLGILLQQRWVYYNKDESYAPKKNLRWKYAPVSFPWSTKALYIRESIINGER